MTAAGVSGCGWSIENVRAFWSSSVREQTIPISPGAILS
jgi:hypothetical protein